MAWSYNNLVEQALNADEHDPQAEKIGKIIAELDQGSNR